MSESNAFTPSAPLKTAVLFLIFNRLDTTRQVFETIRQAKPPQLYIAADGPRADRPGESERVQAVRDYVMNSIDWDCEVKTLFRYENLGCKRAVSSAIDWFFSQVEEGIILEDDCIPHFTFFHFCEELLKRYRNDERIAMISGNNFQFGEYKTEGNYYFSRYPHIWGWASWRRAWNNYDIDMTYWPKLRDREWLQSWFGNGKIARYWTKVFEKTYQGKIDTWDYQWTFTCWTQNQLSILPNVNLVSNIGFGPGAVHTTVKDQFYNMKAETMHFPLKHPHTIIPDFRADNTTERKTFSGNSGLLMIIRKVRYYLQK